MIRAWRLASARVSAADGSGAALHGGRWNPAGTHMVYAASTPSLAALEILLHFGILPRDFVLTPIEIPDRIAVRFVPDSQLPEGWKAIETAPAAQEFGGRWAQELKSAVLSVPSSLVPEDRIYLLNPHHPDFAHINFLPPKPFQP